MKLKNTLPLFFVALVFLLFIVWVVRKCDGDEGRDGPEKKYNYIILLDLSDRIVDTIDNDQISRDTALVNYILSCFIARVKQNPFDSKDEIKVRIAPQKNTPYNKVTFEEKLCIDMEKETATGMSLEKMETLQKNFKNALNELYLKAAFSKKPKDYNGADINSYFAVDLEKDIVQDTVTAKNFLFLLTDGYPVVGKQTDNLDTKLNKDFSKVNVMVTEIIPNRNMDKNINFEYLKITGLWNEWLKNMNINNIYINKHDAPLNLVQKEITSFIASGLVQPIPLEKPKEIIKDKTKPSDSISKKTDLSRQSAIGSKDTSKTSFQNKIFDKNTLEKKINQLGDKNFKGSKETLRREILGYFNNYKVTIEVTNQNNITTHAKYTLNDYLLRIQQNNGHIDIRSLQNIGGRAISVRILDEKY